MPAFYSHSELSPERFGVGGWPGGRVEVDGEVGDGGGEGEGVVG